MKIQDYLDSFCSEIKAAGLKMLNEELPKLREEDFFLFKETGNRLIYEGEYFGRRKFLTVFGIIAEYPEIFNKDFNNQEVIKKLSYILEEICNEKLWALPAHVNFDNLDENTIDLFAAETAGTLAEMLFLFEAKLDTCLVEKIKKEITNRVLKPFCESAFPYNWWEYDKCNWSAVCAGSIGMAAIYMDRIKALPGEWKDSCLERVCNALKCYLDGMEEDGACTEGLGYFSYGMSYFTGFAEVYKEETGIDLMDNEKVHQIATFQQKCYFGKGISISFSDGSTRENYLPGLTAFLQSNFMDVEIPDIFLARGLEQDACYRWVTNERNIKWLLKYDASVSFENPQSKFYLLPSAQWMIVKDKNGNGFAAKGGHNEENHNHNDIGHFLCVFEGEMLLSDLGAGEYTKDYFNDGRYTILCNRALGHSVPLINDKEQLPGKQFAAESFKWKQEEKSLEISFAKAYETGIIEDIKREISFLDSVAADMEIEITDSFKGNANTKTITESLVTTYLPELMEDHLEIHGENGYCEILGISERPQIIPMEHSLHDGKKVTVYLVHWNLDLDEKRNAKEQLKINFYKK